MIKQNDLIEENIGKAVFAIAIPSMLTIFLENSYNIVDAIWIGKLGPDALAAVTASGFLVWLTYCTLSMIPHGVNSLAANYSGAKDQLSLQKVTAYGMRYGLLMTFLMIILLVPNLNFLLNIMGLSPEVLTNSQLFLIPLLLGLPLGTINMVSSSVYRGIGNARIPLIILGGSIVLNFILAPLLIFGPGFFPELGISGGALATVLAQLVSTVFYLYLLKRDRLIGHYFPRFFEQETLTKLVKIGFPVSASGTVFFVVYLFMTKIIAGYGTAPIAALGVGQRIEGFLYCFCIGLSIAATTLVGQRTGAGQPEKAKEAAWKILYYGCSFMLFVSFFLLTFKTMIAGIFTDDPQVIASAAGYLTAMGATQVFVACEIVMSGVFTGTGNTVPPTLISLPLNILRLPLAYFLADTFGENGIWWSIALSTTLKGTLMVIWFKYASGTEIKEIKQAESY